MDTPNRENVTNQRKASLGAEKRESKGEIFALTVIRTKIEFFALFVPTALQD
ncbi:MAG: hypothetical protein R3F28_05875 [Candidatus Kapaibacterium sp.]